MHWLCPVFQQPNRQDAKERQHAAKPHSCAVRRQIGDFAEHDRTKRPHAKHQADDESGRQADMVRKQPVA
ncbi:hypothetical protein IB49_18435 [Geobacillus sp. LC300]|nr:hypothetical protein IB49_00040 [Geobacillus sp. LC300]AKU27999.1 hypothetical protein IB49_18435 [Geobacillus sp. LC300]